MLPAMSRPDNQPNGRSNNDPTGDRTVDPTAAWLPVAEAAALLGITTDAVRMRIKRSTLLGRKVDRRLQVFVARPNADRTPDPTTDPTATQRRTDRDDDPIDVPYRFDGEPDRALVPVDTMLTATRALGDRLAELAVEVGTLRERTSHQAASMTALQEERDQLRAELERLQVSQVSRDPATEHRAEQAPTEHRPRPWWRFWERR